MIENWFQCNFNIYENAPQCIVWELAANGGGGGGVCVCVCVCVCVGGGGGGGG